MSYASAAQTTPTGRKNKCRVGRAVMVVAHDPVESVALASLLSGYGRTYQSIADILSAETGERYGASMVWRHRHLVCACTPGAGR